MVADSLNEAVHALFAFMRFELDPVGGTTSTGFLIGFSVALIF